MSTGVSGGGGLANDDGCGGVGALPTRQGWTSSGRWLGVRSLLLLVLAAAGGRWSRGCAVAVGKGIELNGLGGWWAAAQAGKGRRSHGWWQPIGTWRLVGLGWRRPVGRGGGGGRLRITYAKVKSKLTDE